MSRRCLGSVSEVSRKCLEELLALLCRAPLLPQVGRVDGEHERPSRVGVEGSALWLADGEVAAKERLINQLIN